MKIDTLRGHNIYFDGKEYRYSDNNKRTIEVWKERPCGNCGKFNTPEGHDYCLGTLPDVINACCGHGEENSAYLQFEDKSIIRGIKAIKKIKEISKSHPTDE